MSCSLKTRCGVLGVLRFGFILGSIAACTNTQLSKPVDAGQAAATEKAGEAGACLLPHLAAMR